ncbi:MAG: hypothetical protein M3Y91_08015 [Actinomycetota bacterium]|nr:hypothetical protein [Actinomycetota bacterium]
MDLDAVADELYGLTPGEFTAARQARAVAASRAGDRDLAAAIKALRRPTTSAWLANLLRRQRHTELLQLLELGEATRRAHSNLDAEDLRRLSRQRRQAVAALSHDARRLARDLGPPVSGAVGRELEVTLEAAFADPGASEAVRSGRLTTALSYSGLGPIDVTAPVGGPAVVPGAPVVPTAKELAKSGRDEVDRHRQKRTEAAAVQAIGEALAAVAEAKESAEAQQRDLADARDRLEVRRRQVSDLEQQLQEARALRDRGTEELGHVEQAQAAVEGGMRAAAHQLDRVQAELERLRR